MNNWEPANELLKLSDKLTYKYEAHKPVKRKSMPWVACQHCGLVYFRNDFTKWAIRKGCMNYWHPGKRKFLSSAK